MGASRRRLDLIRPFPRQAQEQGPAFNPPGSAGGFIAALSNPGSTRYAAGSSCGYFVPIDDGDDDDVVGLEGVLGHRHRGNHSLVAVDNLG